MDKLQLVNTVAANSPHSPNYQTTTTEVKLPFELGTNDTSFSEWSISLLCKVQQHHAAAGQHVRLASPEQMFSLYMFLTFAQALQASHAAQPLHGVAAVSLHGTAAQYHAVMHTLLLIPHMKASRQK